MNIMKKPGSIALSFIVANALCGSLPAFGGEQEVIEEIVTIGTRSTKARSADDSPVPIDVIGPEDFEALGNTADMTDNLKALVPSYTATPATGDGSAFVRPTSLRGTAPDQTLVLINGKRRHRSALVQFFAPAAGNGAHGVDIGMIPSLAIQRIEVLRDGAASQYGSDAIAGVLNFVLKDDADGGQVQVQFGEYFDGEQSVRIGANAGFPIGDIGFVNVTMDAVDNDALSRGIQRPNAQALIDNGVPGVGADAPFGDSPLVQTWGRPETEGVRFFLNSGFRLNDSAELYARFSLAETDGRYRFFYRNPSHSSLTAHRAEGYTGHPAGFTPYLDGEQNDTSFVIGIEGEFAMGLAYDVSYGYGKNELDYFLNNTVNGDLPLTGTCPGCEISQMGFDVGGYAQEENNINLDFSYLVSDRVNLAFGFEAREETFTAFAGEPNSFFGGGSSGFRGIEPANAGDFKRDNVAVYADIEHDISDQLLLQYAIRYENFSDFGNTLNGKLAARYRVNESLAFRAAVSTGFHAPTPGQSNVSTIITTFDGTTGLQVEEGLFPVSNPDVIAAGGSALKEEQSDNISFGFTANLGDLVTLTTDFYRIEVSDRIYRTGDIPVPPQPSDPSGAPARSISFYTNALDVEHQGVDVVATSSFELGSETTLNLALAYAYNEIEVTSQKLINGIQPVSDGLVEDIENNYPEHRWVLTGNFLMGEKFNVMTRVNFFGDHYDERGRIGVGPGESAKIDASHYVDVEFGWDINDNWRAVLGGSNVFDEYVDEIGDPNANRLSVGLQYPRRTVANYEGGSWYLRTVYRF